MQLFVPNGYLPTWELVNSHFIITNMFYALNVHLPMTEPNCSYMGHIHSSSSLWIKDTISVHLSLGNRWHSMVQAYCTICLQNAFKKYLAVLKLIK